MSSNPSTSVEMADTVSAILYAIAGWLLVGLGSLGLVGTALRIGGNTAPTNLALSTVVVLLSLTMILFGVFVNPRFRRRLDRGGPVTDFGRTRSVDSRPLRPGEGRTVECVICGTRTDRGLVRRYREEFRLAGLPVSTRSEGRNHYCLDCATAEPTNRRPVGSVGSIEESVVESDDRLPTEER
jgi:hypothetical protein